jgi:iron complex outermembrane receptor protein
VQDDIAIVPERLRVMLGMKVGHNAYSGFELQPGARMMWSPARSNVLFAAVTRAVRTPSRVETDYTTTSLVDPGTPTFVRLQPNPEFVAEKLTAYEAGYRAQPWPGLYVSASGFFNDLDDMLSTELLTAFVETTPSPSRLVLPVTFANGLYGTSHGLEVTGDIRPASWWRGTVNYAFLRVQMARKPGSADVSQERRYEGLSPRHQVQLQSSLDLPHRVSVDWLLRYASELPAGPVPAYATSSLRVAWQPSPRLEIGVTGQNLHEARHIEWPSGGAGTIELRRRAVVDLTWRR